LGLGVLPVASFLLAIFGAAVAWFSVFRRMRNADSVMKSRSL